MSNAAASSRIRGAILELKDAVRQLIEKAPAEGVERVFEAVYWERSSLSVRSARLAIFNGIVALLASDLRAEKRAFQKARKA